MEKQTPSIGKSALTYGLYLGLASIVFTLILYLTEMLGNSALGWISFIISIAILSWAMINFRDKQNGGVLRYGQGVGLGTLSMFFGGILSSIFTFVLYNYIDPGIIDQLVNQALEEAMAKGTPEAQMEMVEKWTRMFMNPTAMLIMGIIGSPIIGAIISLILAAIFKKEPPVFEAAEATE